MISFSKLPKEYQQVEYIENSGTQYIDTGLYPLDITSGKFDITLESMPSGDPVFFMGGFFSTAATSGAKYYSPLLINKNNNKVGIGGINGWKYSNYVWNLKERHNVSFEFVKQNQSLYIDDVEVIKNTDNIDRPETNVTVLFLTYQYGTQKLNNYGWIGKIYSIKLYGNNNELIRNLIPCYRKSDDEVGLYDVVNNTFYTNAGTGTFSKGEDIVIKNIVINNKDVKKLEDINGNVWWEKSKGGNIFDPTTATILQAYFENGVPNITSNTGNRLTYVACKPNTTYKITKLLGKIFWIGCTVNEPDIGVATTSRQVGTQDTYDGTTTTTMTFTTDSTANYLAIRYTSIWTDGSANETTIFNSIEVYEQ